MGDCCYCFTSLCLWWWILRGIYSDWFERDSSWKASKCILFNIDPSPFTSFSVVIWVAAYIMKSILSGHTGFKSSKTDTFKHEFKHFPIRFQRNDCTCTRPQDGQFRYFVKSERKKHFSGVENVVVTHTARCKTRLWSRPSVSDVPRGWKMGESRGGMQGGWVRRK